MRQLTFAVQSYAQEREDDLPWSGATDRNMPMDWVFGGQSEAALKDRQAWKNPDFGIHAESGSLFPFVMSGQDREVVHSDADRRVFPTYRCPSTEELGAVLRVNYSLNIYVDPLRRDRGIKPANARSYKYTTVVAPSQKVMFVGEAPANMTDGAFDPKSSLNRAGQIFQLHNKSSNLSFFDGSVHSILGDAMLGVVKTMDQLDRHFDIRKQ